MPSLYHPSTPLKLAGAVLALALIAAVAVALILTAEPTQAQSTTYDAPHPCGPGFDEFYALPEFPVDQVNTGHFAIFDAYYDLDSDEPHRPTEEGEAWAGLMGLNFCPPKLEQSTSGRPPTTVTTRSQANIDINDTVFHVDQAEHTLTADEAAAYPFLGTAGDAVYWLRVGDDPNTSGVTEQASDFQISFSTALLDAKYWHRKDDEGDSIASLWYEVEAQRELGLHPREYGHIYVFDHSNAGEEKRAIWNSKRSDTGSFDMEPGQYRNLQWVFTKPGTYELEVQLNGHTRQDRPDNLPEDELWHPVSEELIVTSEVRRYVFRVGTLTLDEQPMFKAPDRKIPENSPAGTNVGHPVPVTGAGDDILIYKLSGEGHTDFEVVSVAGGGQIKVASAAVVDYETKAAYDLVLTVSDGKNREGDDDQLRVDSTIAVRITLENEIEAGEVHVTARVSPEAPSASGRVTFTATVHNLPGSISRDFTLHTANSDGSPDYTLISSADTRAANQTFTLTGDGNAGTKFYIVSVSYLYNDEGITVYSDPLTVQWQ